MITMGIVPFWGGCVEHRGIDDVMVLVDLQNDLNLFQEYGLSSTNNRGAIQLYRPCLNSRSIPELLNMPGHMRRLRTSFDVIIDLTRDNFYEGKDPKVTATVSGTVLQAATKKQLIEKVEVFYRRQPPLIIHSKYGTFTAHSPYELAKKMLLGAKEQQLKIAA